MSTRMGRKWWLLIPSVLFVATVIPISGRIAGPDLQCHLRKHSCASGVPSVVTGRF